MGLRYHYFTVQEEVLLDTSCLCLLPPSGSVLSSPDTKTAARCCPHLVSVPYTATGPGWSQLIK